MGDNTRQVIRNEETVASDQPKEATVTQTSTSTTDAAGVPAPVAPAASESSVQTTTSTTTPSDRVVAHNVAERVVDPAAEKAATVAWINRFVWFIIGLLSLLLIIRFVLLALGANESVGFAQLIYGLTGWLVAPFAGLFGRQLSYPGTAGTGVLEYESLVAIVVLVIIGWIITKIVDLSIGTNRTTGTVYSDTERRTKL